MRIGGFIVLAAALAIVGAAVAQPETRRGDRKPDPLGDVMRTIEELRRAPLSIVMFERPNEAPRRPVTFEELEPLQRRIWEFWFPPEGQLTGPMSITLRVAVGERGKVLSSRIEQRRYDPADAPLFQKFADMVTFAMRRVATLPLPLPAGKEHLFREFLLTFDDRDIKPPAPRAERPAPRTPPAVPPNESNSRFCAVVPSGPGLDDGYELKCWD